MKDTLQTGHVIVDLPIAADSDTAPILPEKAPVDTSNSSTGQSSPSVKPKSNI